MGARLSDSSLRSGQKARASECGARVVRLEAPAAVKDGPRRPDSDTLSEAIPLSFIGRNKDGFWVARDADTRIGGLFLSRWGALRFARRRPGRTRSATMFVSQGLELEGANYGNPFVSRLAPMRRIVARIRAPLSASVEKLAGSARRFRRRIALARAIPPVHGAAIKRELFGQQCKNTFRCDDDPPIVPGGFSSFNETAGMTTHIRTLDRSPLTAAQRSTGTDRTEIHRNPHLAALTRFCKVATVLLLFALVMAGLLALDVAIWVPRAHP